MKRNLYDLCNLIETDLSGYEGEALGELEIQKRKEALRRRAGVSGRRGRRLGTAAACVAAVCLLSQTAFARELAGRVLAMVGLGNSRVVQTREPGEDEPLPEEMRGRLFDQNGRELMTYGEVLRAAGMLYNGEGERIVSFDGEQALTKEEYEEQERIEEENTFTVTDPRLLSDYTTFPVLLPASLPEDIRFSHAKFVRSRDSGERLRWTNLYFVNGKGEEVLLLQEREDSPEMAYVSATDGTVEEITVAGHSAALVNGNEIDFERDGTLLSLIAKAPLTCEELIAVAESIQ